jgi:hypothetical protein
LQPHCSLSSTAISSAGWRSTVAADSGVIVEVSGKLSVAKGEANVTRIGHDFSPTLPVVKDGR